MTQNSGVQRRQEPDFIDIRRNPYLVDYEEQRRLRTGISDTRGRRQVRQSAGYGQRERSRRSAGGYDQELRQVRQPAGYGQRERSRRSAGGYDQELRQVRQPAGYGQRERSRRSAGGYDQELRQGRPTAGSTGGTRRSAETSGRAGSHRGERRALQTVPVNRAGNRQAAARRRKRYIRRQRIAVSIFACGIIAVFLVLMIKPESLEAAGGNQNVITDNRQEEITGTDLPQEETIQGLPAADFLRHPYWTEDFLTPNEYSRPGEPLPEIKNIFVHYTANPGTSAAQNRSYFEQQKDTHEVSVSSHFIIGYEGEIVQCVPLTEIAYAVQSRNYDSISIECCFKAADGSFTQETYDSLISLLAWLTDVYDLEAEDILRHYDCGGKKCPSYYTEHPDAWEKLKEDVAQARTE